jgi:RNA 3'-terminal phosphate cyclase (ATP)
MGEVTLTTEPCKNLKPLRLESFGKMQAIQGASVCTFLAERRVAERQAKAADDYLREKGYAADIQVIDDMSNPLQKGSSIVLWAETDTGTILGADAIGELRKPSEAVGREAAEKLCTEISPEPTVDVHLADMLIPYVTFADGRSAYLARTLSDHLETNIWLAQQILGTKFNVERVKGLYRIEKAEEIGEHGGATSKLRRQ